jgi:AI-2 transport protein TqsA
MITRPQQPSDRRVQTVCLLILTLIAVAVAMYLMQPILVPFMLALFFSQCLSPIIDYLMRRFHLPQVLAVTIAALLVVGCVTGIGFLLASSIADMSKRQTFSGYQAHVDAFTNRVMDSRAAHWLGIHPRGQGDEAPLQLGDRAVDLFQFVAAIMGSILRNTATVFILMAFLLYGRRRSVERNSILKEIEIRVQRYISLTVAISLLTGLLVGFILGFLHVQFAAGFGFLAFLLNFIPNFGAVIATLLPLPLVLVDPHLSILAKLAAIILPALVQALIGSFLQPRALGQSLDLHPVVLLLSLVFFTLIWGIAGAFLATPLTAVIKIVFEKIPATRSLAAALAGNLDPLVESLDPPRSG